MKNEICDEVDMTRLLDEFKSLIPILFDDINY
jgi:hypothetical protein